MMRSPLSAMTVARIRRERYEPRVTQCDYLHLRDLRTALVTALAELKPVPGPALDLYCGTQPYREFIPASPVWGLDLDRHFGRANVSGNLPLPFADKVFSLILCSQALHLVDDPAATVGEMARVLKPGGLAVITVPRMFLREIPQERAYSDHDIRRLFVGWSTSISGFGGLGSALALWPGSLLNRAARHWWFPRFVLPVPAILLNIVGTLIDIGARALGRPENASWIAVCRYELPGARIDAADNQ